MSSHDSQEDHQPSRIPIQVDTALPPAASDKEPPLGDNPLDSPTTEPFAPILEVLERLKREDPKLAFQASRLVGHCRRLWESCESKHLDIENLEQSSQSLIETNAHLRKERDGLKARHNEQLSRLRIFEQAQELSRQRLIEVFDLWNQCPRGQLAIMVDSERRA